MPKYKITASKSQKKYTFVLNAENEILAKKRIHKEGYSILWVELFNETNINKKNFLFKAEKSWEIKKWKVLGNDIFKIYLKLRDWVWYNILELYPEEDKNKDDNYKKNLIKELEEQYNFFKWTKKQKKEDNKYIEQKKEINIDDFYLKKQLEETYKLIDFVLKKVNNFLSNKDYNIEAERREKLQKLYNTLVKLKSSTNIIKLKEIWEAVLLKIWEIEIEYLEKEKIDKSKIHLQETNKLLKELWSNKRFTPKNKQLENFINNIKFTFKEIFKKQKKKEKRKKEISYSSLKDKVFLNKYKQKLKQNNVDLLKNFYIFLFPFWKNKQQIEDLLIKREVIKQNIQLLKAKISGNIFSYTKTLKWFHYFLEAIFKFFLFIRNYMFFVVIIYSLLFLIFLNLEYIWWIKSLELSINYNWVFYFIMFLFLYFAIYFSRGFYSLVLNFMLILFVYFVWIINFY